MIPPVSAEVRVGAVDTDRTETGACEACAGDECAELRCPKSKRSCGHHCNCVMVHDHCHWCGEEWGQE